MARLNLDCKWAWVHQGSQLILDSMVLEHNMLCPHSYFQALRNMVKGVTQRPIVCIFNKIRKLVSQPRNRYYMKPYHLHDLQITEHTNITDNTAFSVTSNSPWISALSKVLKSHIKGKFVMTNFGVWSEVAVGKWWPSHISRDKQTMHFQHFCSHYAHCILSAQ